MSKRAEWDIETSRALDAACQTLIETARQNPSGECWALVKAVDAETGETFEIAVRKAAKQG